VSEEPPRDASVDVPIVEDASSPVDDLPEDDVQIEDPLIELEEQPGCGCRAPGGEARDASRSPAALLLAALGLVLRARRRPLLRRR